MTLGDYRSTPIYIYGIQGVVQIVQLWGSPLPKLAFGPIATFEKLNIHYIHRLDPKLAQS